MPGAAQSSYLENFLTSQNVWITIVTLLGVLGFQMELEVGQQRRS